jgi:hypothetical protein
MPTTIIVSFGPHSEFEFKVHDEDANALTREQAGEWLHEQYEALECTPRNPIGKILLLDVILDVAKYGGKDRFTEDYEWGRHFAVCCAAALKRDTRVDVPNLVVG